VLVITLSLADAEPAGVCGTRLEFVVEHAKRPDRDASLATQANSVLLMRSRGVGGAGGLRIS
jgi:hypothetical protein